MASQELSTLTKRPEAGSFSFPTSVLSPVRTLPLTAHRTTLKAEDSLPQTLTLPELWSWTPPREMCDFLLFVIDLLSSVWKATQMDLDLDLGDRSQKVTVCGQYLKEATMTLAFLAPFKIFCHFSHCFGIVSSASGSPCWVLWCLTVLTFLDWGLSMVLENSHTLALHIFCSQSFKPSD